MWLSPGMYLAVRRALDQKKRLVGLHFTYELEKKAVAMRFNPSQHCLSLKCKPPTCSVSSSDDIDTIASTSPSIIQAGKYTGSIRIGRMGLKPNPGRNRAPSEPTMSLNIQAADA